jgi:flagellar basal-body rod modification protein FlgD
MDAVQSSGITQLSASGNLPGNSVKPAVDDAQDRFLKLLVTQMKNQDPLNPLDNAQVTSQLAQISTVSGIDKLNTTLQTMAASFASNQSLQATSMIGHGVLAPGSALTLQNGGAIGGVDVPQTVDRLTVTIKDSAGIAVHTVDLGPQPAGTIAFQWDGITDSGAPAASGTYSFAVSAQQGGSTVNAVTLSYGLVNGVSNSAQGVSLNVGGLGVVALSDVKQVM